MYGQSSKSLTLSFQFSTGLDLNIVLT